MQGRVRFFITVSEHVRNGKIFSSIRTVFRAAVEDEYGPK